MTKRKSFTLHRVETSCAASMAAYGDDSSLSALTFMPPELMKKHILELLK